MYKVKFNSPYITGLEIEYIQKAISTKSLCGDGFFTKRAQELIENDLKVSKSLLTHSCTASLEMAALLLEIKPGDEVILPSYTFVSTANAFALRGAEIVFADIRESDCNIDENKIESLISRKTKAIVPVHYAGAPCEMDRIKEIAKLNNIYVVEDAAQAYGSTYKGASAGALGDMAAFSFHETKNIVSGEGGCLIVNNQNFLNRAEIIREKGTNRKAFYNGIVDKYTWKDVGSSFLPGELIAAFLTAQLENAALINQKRKMIWDMYFEKFEILEERGLIFRPRYSESVQHNAHMFYLILKNQIKRDELIHYLRERGVEATFHYIPLHKSDYGKRYKKNLDLKITERVASSIVRLPIWADMGDLCNYVIQVVDDFFKEKND